MQPINMFEAQPMGTTCITRISIDLQEVSRIVCISLSIKLKSVLVTSQEYLGNKFKKLLCSEGTDTLTSTLSSAVEYDDAEDRATLNSLK
jgi:hypothetical protein